MPESLKKLRIFVASPSDVASERAKLETVADSLKPMADYLGLTLEVIDWRSVVPDAGRPQQVIIDQLKPTSWDIFVGILWHRFGTPPSGKDPQTKKDYLSGTEEEFRTAYRLWSEYKKPRIVMYRCSQPIPQEADFTQAQRVKDFFKEIQDPSSEFRMLTQSFDTTESFQKLLLDNLQKLLIEYGEQEKTPITSEVVQTLAPVIPNNLPRRPAFFGRTKEMETVMRALSPADRTWGVLVDGIGGIGKSSIAIEAAYRAQGAGSFEAFVFVTAKQNILEPSGIKELNPPAHTLDEFLNETSRILGQSGITKLTGEEKRRALIGVLRSMRALLIYDNLETLSKEEQEGIADFLRELPQGCKAIITSRRRGGEGGVWLRVGKLDWDAALGIIKNQMALDVILENKLNRVGESRWQELFDETNGSPLALVHSLGLMRVRAALTFERAVEMLHGNRDADLQKFIFQEAHKELTENDKAALGALSFFIPSATFEAWIPVAKLSRNALETTINRLSALSLVDILEGEERYALHPLTRAFVRDKLLSDANTTHATGMLFARYWVDYAKLYGGSFMKNYKTYYRLESEWENLYALANWSWDESKIDGNIITNMDAALIMIELLPQINVFMSFSGRNDEKIKLFTYQYEIAMALKDWDDAGWSAYELAWSYYYRGDAKRQEIWVDRCDSAWSNTRNRLHHASVLRLRGFIAKQNQRYDDAKKLLLKALGLYKGRGRRYSMRVFNDLGNLAYERKNYSSAKSYYNRALKLANETKDKTMKATCAYNIGRLALDRGQTKEARKWFNQISPIAHELGILEKLAQASYGIARVEELEGRLDLALPLAQEALKIYERLRHKELVEVREFVERLKKAEG